MHAYECMFVYCLFSECDPDQCVLDIPVCREDQTLIATRAEGSCCLAHICSKSLPIMLTSSQSNFMFGTKHEKLYNSGPFDIPHLQKFSSLRNI